MKLSPRMIQAMEILQLPLMALQERIQEELTSNPCLEMREGADEATETPPAADAETGPDRGEEAMVIADDDTHQKDFERLDEYDQAYPGEMDSSDRPYRPAAASGERDAKLDALANTPAPDETLAEHLLGQWAFVDVPADVAAAGETIISNIDDDGYIRTPVEELARDGAPPITPAGLAAALPLVQKLDPPGVGARDLRECLLIQLDAEVAAGQDVALPRQLASEFLREIELNHIPLIAKRTGQSVEQINAAIAALGRLHPRPGRLIGSGNVPHIVPDAMVDLDEDGQVVVTMRDDDRPGLRLSRTYRKMIRASSTDATARDFIRRNLRSAQWLIGAILQRRRTVRRVVEEVFAVQTDFLERGREALRPLPMMEVATKVGVHVATVSRAVAGKYVQTPRGIFPLRMFFTGGKTTAAGEDVAWDAIKVRLREIVDREDKAAPLADDQIADALRAKGIKIARRTVAKYRNLLNIPPARQRRQY